MKFQGKVIKNDYVCGRIGATMNNTENRIEYIVWLISEFASKYRMSLAQAYKYLNNHGAIAFANDNYNVIHTFSLDSAVDDMTDFCRRNGGLVG